MASTCEPPANLATSDSATAAAEAKQSKTTAAKKEKKTLSKQKTEEEDRLSQQSSNVDSAEECEEVSLKITSDLVCVSVSQSVRATKNKTMYWPKERGRWPMNGDQTIDIIIITSNKLW